MFRKSADTLLFGTGTPVRIRTGNQERVILDKEVRTEQIVKLLRPVAGSAAAELREDGETRFIYDAPAGRVRVTATTRGDRMMAVVLPAPDPGVDDVVERIVSASRSSYEEDAPIDLGLLADSAVDLAAEANKQPPLKYPRQPPARASSSSVSSDIEERESSTAPRRQSRRPEYSASPSERSVDSRDRSADASEHPAREPDRSLDSSKREAEAPGRSSGRPKHPPVASEGEPEINAVLRALVEGGGSDLHLTTDERPRIRVDGDIAPLDGWNDRLTSDQIERWMRGVAHEKAGEQFDETHDADFAHEIADVARFRMNWFRDRNGVGAVMRTIPSKVLTADQLGLPAAIRQLCTLPKGLVVVTGPTGSGKSTTLAAMVDLINKTRADHIITIEDPVEFVHKSIKCLVNQREVHSHTKSFSAALRAALREDPDIVLVGELRDLETVHIAIETAETGHLVLGTLHTNTAASTVDRMIDQFSTDQQAQIRVMLSESLRGVVAQTLCKKKGGGRVACMEILIGNNAVGNLIREGKTFQIESIMQTNRGIGMQTQVDHMLRLVKEDLVEPAEAYRKAVDPSLMKQALERAGYRVPEAA